MKKYLIVSVLVVLMGNLALAQTEEREKVPRDPKAKGILDKLSEKNKSYKSIKADFVYRLENEADGIDEKQEGNILLSGNKYRLNIAGQEIVSNGETMWTYIEDADEVQISEVPDEEEDDQGLFNPAKLFTVYEEGFKYVYEEEKDIDGKQVHVIKLYPMDPSDKSYHTLILNVLKSEMQIHSMVIKSKDGNTFTYELKNLQPNFSVSPDTFNFDEDKAGDVIDLR